MPTNASPGGCLKTHNSRAAMSAAPWTCASRRLRDSKINGCKGLDRGEHSASLGEWAFTCSWAPSKIPVFILSSGDLVILREARCPPRREAPQKLLQQHGFRANTLYQGPICVCGRIFDASRAASADLDKTVRYEAD